MDNPSIYQQVNDFIQAGNTEAVFSFLEGQELTASLSKALTIIEAEFRELEESELKGTLDIQDIQVRKNQIHDKLLTLAEKAERKQRTSKTDGRLLWIGILVVLLSGAGIIAWSFFKGDTYDCPDYPQRVKNKILIFPFENVGNVDAKPQIVLRDRINQLATEFDLSSSALVGNQVENLSIDKVPTVAERCDANVLIWGTYSLSNDSLRMVLQYVFTEFPEWNNLGEVVALKDVTGLQNGRMVKSLDDAVLSLCGVIAARKGDATLTKRWLRSVKEKETLDRKVLDKLD